ncbi:hypothetical protein [Lysobacter capsici]|uniref:hypothetical protein n=1 Tax=Lysobacter capsici TaxID=435897 RepID=UPI00128E59A6|nr:hypothetical protein [Lysobacter capsici]
MHSSSASAIAFVADVGATDSSNLVAATASAMRTIGCGGCAWHSIYFVESRRRGRCVIAIARSPDVFLEMSMDNERRKLFIGGTVEAPQLA